MTTQANNFADEIEAAACGEEIIGIRISPGRDCYHDPSDWDDDPDLDKKRYPRIEPRVYSWSEARPLLSYSYDAGCGSQDCHSIYAWTSSWVLFVHEYDGATRVHRVPRNPDGPETVVCADGIS